MASVVILCGGRGKRLRAMTSDVPKPLVELNGKPVIERVINFYMKKGFRKFILCAGYRAGAIDRFITRRRFDADIKISNAGENAGMLKRLYACRSLMTKEAIVTYGDTFIDINPKAIIAAHNRNKPDITISAADIRSPFGLVEFDKKNRVTSFEEKPLLQYYIGHMVINKNILEGLDKKIINLPDGLGLVKLFKELIKSRRLGLYRHKGLNITFNTPYEHKKAEEEFIKFFTRQEG